MANTVNVLSLEKIASMQSGDTLLLIRTADDGTQTCYRILGSDFHGKDAYTIAVEKGYTGTVADFENQCQTVADFSVDFNPDEGTIEITQ